MTFNLYAGIGFILWAIFIIVTICTNNFDNTEFIEGVLLFLIALFTAVIIVFLWPIALVIFIGFGIRHLVG